MRKILRPITVIVLLLSLLVTVNAYQIKNSWVKTDMDDLRFHISTTASTYVSQINSYTLTWEQYCPEVELTFSSSNHHIYFYGELGLENDAYASSTPNSNDYCVITLYSDFVSATYAEQNETIVHEVGHALGLMHCEPGKETLSVMRENGFNGRSYPLSDDILGITYIYQNYVQ